MPATEVRVRNRRGEGTKLRQEIVAAAVEILETSGNAEAVTLRAVARHVGIAAPSIYAHFADREAILMAVVHEGFVGLIAALEGAITPSADPVERLRLGCRAYLDFGAARPHVYQLMFGCGAVAPRPGSNPAYDEAFVGSRALAILVEGIEDAANQGLSASQDYFADAVATWVALHGLCTLMADNSGFPWPDREQLLNTLVDRLALPR